VYTKFNNSECTNVWIYETIHVCNICVCIYVCVYVTNLCKIQSHVGGDIGHHDLSDGMCVLKNLRIGVYSCNYICIQT